MRTLYMLTDSINGKIYIGSTDSMYERLRKYVYASKTRNSILFQRLREVGFSSFTVKKLCFGSNEYIRELERKAIGLYNTIWPIGYNMVKSTYGGGVENKVKSKQVKQRPLSINGVVYENPYIAAEALGTTVHNVRGRCKRHSKGYLWL